MVVIHCAFCAYSPQSELIASWQHLATNVQVVAAQLLCQALQQAQLASPFQAFRVVRESTRLHRLAGSDAPTARSCEGRFSRLCRPRSCGSIVQKEEIGIAIIPQ